MHIHHRICTRPPYPCGIGTSRIFLALNQEFYGFQNVLQSLCYGGHEAPVASVALEVIVAIFACHQQESPRFGTGHPFLDVNLGVFAVRCNSWPGGSSAFILPFDNRTNVRPGLVAVLLTNQWESMEISLQVLQEELRL